MGSLLPAAAAVMVACPTGLADFDGLEIEEVSPTGMPATLKAINLYATFTDPTDKLLGYGGEEQDPMLVTATGGFHHETISGSHQNFAVPQAVLDVFPSMAWDSYLTIGVASGDPKAGTIDDQTSAIGIDFGTWNEGGPLTTDFDLGGALFLFDQGASGQGFPDANGRVLMAQLVGDRGPGTIDGYLGFLLWRGAEDPGATEVNGLTFSEPLPAPPVAALLAIVAAAGRRRQRR